MPDNVEESRDRIACGIFQDKASAEQAIERLSAAGFSREKISVVMSSDEKAQQMIEETGTMAEEGASTGVRFGVTVGGALGIVAGLGLLAIPGLGPFVAAGPIIAGIIGAAAGGAVAGLSGGLIGMGIPEHEAGLFQERVEQGWVLITVHCGERCELARSIMEDLGAGLASCSI